MTTPHHDHSPAAQNLLSVTADRLGDGRVVIGATGEIDLLTAATLAAALEAEPAPDTAAIVLDLTKVTFCSSTGLNELLKIHTRATGAGIPLMLVIDEGASLRRTLDLVGLLDLFTVCSDQATALAADPR